MTNLCNNFALALIAFALTGAEFTYAGVIKSPMSINKKERVKGQARPISLANRTIDDDEDAEPHR